MKFLIVVLLCVAAIQGADARTFSRGELVRELMRQRFPRSSIPAWVCLVEYESKRRTDTRKRDPRGSAWGLFGIHDSIWCKRGIRGGACNTKCEDLISDDITAAARCAKHIFNQHPPYGGFSAWEGWMNNCQDNLPNLSNYGLSKLC